MTSAFLPTKAQRVGINIETPENTLDVNGTMRVRNVPVTPYSKDILQVMADRQTGDLSVRPFKFPEAVDRVQVFRDIRIPVTNKSVGFIVPDLDLTDLLNKRFNLNYPASSYVVAVNGVELMWRGHNPRETLTGTSLMGIARSNDQNDAAEWDNRIGKLHFHRNQQSGIDQVYVCDRSYGNPHPPKAVLNATSTTPTPSSAVHSPLFYTPVTSIVSYRQKEDGTPYWSLYLDTGDSEMREPTTLDFDWNFSVIVLLMPLGAERGTRQYDVINEGRPSSRTPSRLIEVQ